MPLSDMSQAPPSRLQSLDYSFVQQCMHCGLCLPTCPTYTATLEERHGPRGRIALMRAIADRQLEPSLGFAREMYFCLGCLACTTACPAGVKYATLFETARAEVEDRRLLARPARTLIRVFAVRWLFTDLRRLRAAGRAIRLYQQLGLQRLLRASGLLRLLPRRLRGLEAMTPTIQQKFSCDLIPEHTPARGNRRYRVALLTGCAQDLIYSDINRDTAEVLAAAGCEVFTPAQQSCCGSLHAHNGEARLAADLARRNIDQFPPEHFDAIISNAGGCGSHLKHYAHLLHNDPTYRTRAALWDRKLKDIHEWLDEIGIRPPQPPSRAETVVTYHESCHLAHGQGITAPPRRLLQAIPGLHLVELQDSTGCCGSAGVYNLTQPAMADALLQKKLGHIRSTGALLVATANPGCLLQLQNGALHAGLRLRIVHPITLLAEAYRAEASSRGSP